MVNKLRTKQKLKALDTLTFQKLRVIQQSTKLIFAKKMTKKNN
ncbi:hypothetical protein [Borrelia turicatae]|nr:hypothetical protein [Borrelia turicatae]